MSKYVCTRWAFDLSTWTPSLQQMTQFVGAVQPEERDRLMKFYFIDDFLSSLVGRLLMRKYIAQTTEIEFSAIQFARDARGKPFWMKPADMHVPQICFNVSHQGDYVVLAGITCNDETAKIGIGTDIMKIEYTGGRPLSEFFRLMHSKFSDEEWAHIRHPHHNSFDSLKAFMRHWCLKEAYVKELGVGITVDLQKISFQMAKKTALDVGNSPVTSTKLSVNGVPMDNWYFEEHLLNPKHCAAIAFKNCKPAKNKFVLLDDQQLLLTCDDTKDVDVIAYSKKALRKARKLRN